MSSKTVFKILITVALIVIGSWIVWYFWSVDTVESVAILPFYLTVLCMVYVGLQISKRLIFKSQNWWDWLYYLGLISVMLPAYMITQENVGIYSFMTDYGTLFLIIPALMDGWENTKGK
ncbi:MAG: hypothetical protein HRT57_01545 [Crocinitomicaceae bacterium]|nr:hypothetical protein [Crocinitomicaceae bacterium]